MSTSIELLLESMRYVRDVQKISQAGATSSFASLDNDLEVAKKIKEFARQVASKDSERERLSVRLSSDAVPADSTELFGILNRLNDGVSIVRAEAESASAVLDKVATQLSGVQQVVNSLVTSYNNVKPRKTNPKNQGYNYDQKGQAQNAWNRVVDSVFNRDLDMANYVKGVYQNVRSFSGDSIDQTRLTEMIKSKYVESYGQPWLELKSKYQNMAGELQTALVSLGTVGRRMFMSEELDLNASQRAILTQAVDGVAANPSNVIATVERVFGVAPSAASLAVSSPLSYVSSGVLPSGAPKPSKLVSTAKYALVRDVDVDVVKTCAYDIQAFDKDLSSAFAKLAEPVRNAYSESLQKMDASLKKAINDQSAAATGSAEEASKAALEYRKLQDGKFELLRSLVSEVRSLGLGRYHRMHADFLRGHRACIRYMNLWKAVPGDMMLRSEERLKRQFEMDRAKEAVESVEEGSVGDAAAKINQETKKRVQELAKFMAAQRKEVRAQIDLYFKTIDDVLRKSSEFYKAIDDKIFRDSKVVNTQFLIEDQRKQIDRMIDDVGAHMRGAFDVLSKKYNNGYGALDELARPGTLAMYSLKVARIPLFWTAAKLATKAFEALYSKQVYASAGGNPPHPIVFLSLFVGIDALLNLLVYSVLYTVHYMLGEGAGVIDADLLRDFGSDYLMLTGVLFAVAAIAAVLVYHKKYFRYKFEGKRGISALESIAKSLFLVLLPIPFFLFLR
jgi:hypothetical protein